MVVIFAPVVGKFDYMEGYPTFVIASLLENACVLYVLDPINNSGGVLDPINNGGVVCTGSP